MANLWTFGGLSLPDLLRRTARETWDDSVFGQGGRMAFYQFLAIFPALLVFLVVGARVPFIADQMKYVLQDFSRQLLPDQASQLFQRMMEQLSEQSLSPIQLVSVFAGTLWAAFNATWAMIYGLNRAYEVEERRSWWKLSVTIAGLTLVLAVIGCLALFLIFGGADVEAHFHRGMVTLRVLEWLILIAAVLLALAVLYRFAPDLRDPEWRWSTPGALCALILWVTATFAARAYFDYVNNYSRTYGQLNGVVMFLLWLYITNGAVLIGGEMNSEIEKAAVERRPAGARQR